MGRAFLQGDAGRPGVGVKGLKIHRIYVEGALVDGWQGTLYRFLSARTINERQAASFRKFSPEITQRCKVPAILDFHPASRMRVERGN